MKTQNDLAAALRAVPRGIATRASNALHYLGLVADPPGATHKEQIRDRHWWEDGRIAVRVDMAGLARLFPRDLIRMRNVGDKVLAVLRPFIGCAVRPPTKNEREAVALLRACGDTLNMPQHDDLCEQVRAYIARVTGEKPVFTWESEDD